MQAFISYARRDSSSVDALRREIQALDIPVWIDDRLAGGEDWWSTILDAVRSSDVFVLAVSQSALNSQACEYETRYAIGLKRLILPVVVAPVDLRGLPDELKQFQALQFSGGDISFVRGLAKALLVPRRVPPPSGTAPAPPAVPGSYGDDFRRSLNARVLSTDDQLALAARIKHDCTNPIHGDDARELLRGLRARPDVALVVAQDIDEFLDGSPAGDPAWVDWLRKARARGNR